MSSCHFEYDILKIMQQKDSNEINNLFSESNLFQSSSNQPDRIFQIIMTNVLKHILIENILPDIIESFQKEVLTFNLMTQPRVSAKQSTNYTLIVLHDDNVNRVYRWEIMKIHKKYCKLRDNKSRDHKIEDIPLMLADMCINVTSILHNKDYIRMYLPLDDAIRNKGQFTLVSPPYVKQFSELLKIARRKVMENNKVSVIMLPIEANIISVMRKENESCQYKSISDLCLISWTRVKNNALTISMRKEIIW